MSGFIRACLAARSVVSLPLNTNMTGDPDNEDGADILDAASHIARSSCIYIFF